MYDHLKDKAVLITGGTGSVGSNIARFLLAETSVSKVIIFSRDEHKQHHLSQEIRDPRVRFFLGDVRDRDRLKRAFHNVDIVIHAAALKHVPALEYNPIEAVKTNIYGTQNIIDAAVDEEVEQVLFISSDKAVEPINLYGATKLCAEKLIISANAYSPTGTRFSVVRYGNVLGTRGSVVETLLKTRASGRARITHTDMTRFWITLQESIELVMFALSEMEGGEIFIPRAHSMKLVDLFNVIAPDAEQEVIGLRPGEKLHEMLVSAHEATRAIEIGNYFVILPEFRWMNTDMYRKYHNTGTPQIIGFVFASNTNPRWLTPDNLRAIIAELEKMK